MIVKSFEITTSTRLFAQKLWYPREANFEISKTSKTALTQKH